ncbi:hypothetical protein D3C80_1399940 [compost metagenome]
MQGGIVARVVGEHRDGVHALLALRQRNGITRHDARAVGDVHHLLQADLRIRHTAHCVPAVFGMRIGAWHRGVLHRPRHHLPVCLIQFAGQRCGLRYLVPHGRRETVPHIGETLAPEAGPGHAAEQHEQQRQGAPETDHGMQLTP